MKQLLVFLFILCSASAWAQDVIVKRDGSTIVCRVVEVKGTEIVYKKWGDLEGSNYVMEKSAASAINYESGKRENFSEIENMYAPGNQNDGSQQMNDRALLMIDKESHPKKRRSFKWNIQAGFSGDYLTGGKHIKLKGGYDFRAGVFFPLKQQGWGIGADAFFASSHAGFDAFLRIHGYGLTPYISYKWAIGEKTSIRPYIGPYAWIFTKGGGEGLDSPNSSNSYYLSSSNDEIHVGINVGAKLFFTNNYFVDFHINKGINIVDFIAYEESGYDYATHQHDGELRPTILKVVFGIGVQF